MKPFNLEAAKAGAPVITRSGNAARIICFDRKDENFPIVALLQLEDATEEHVSYTNDGRYWEDLEPEDDDHDLFMAPVQHTVWVNLYKASEAKVGMVSGGLYASEQEAVLIAGESPSYVGTFPITYEE